MYGSLDLSAIVGQLASTLASAALVLAVVAIGGFVITGLGWMRMFKKAGRAPALAFIPIVRSFVKFKVAWNTGAWVLNALCYVASYVLSVAISLSSEGSAAYLGILIASIVVSVANIVFAILLAMKLSKAYGHGGLCGIAFWLVPWITALVVGFGSSEYVGAGGEARADTPTGPTGGNANSGI